MKQVVQTLATGIVEVGEVPIPALTDKFVLVRTTNSAISAGTEKTKIDMGKKSLLQKARARPDLVRQVLKKLRTDGIRKTFRTVSTRLNSPSALGYSCAGTVVAVGGLVEGIRPGDRVACGGADYANHAEFVAVPRNLVVRVPDGVGDEEASFATIGAIALQGVRLAEPLLGETFLVIGLGLLGQLAVQVLRANGCNVIATDLDSELVKRAEKYGARGIAPGLEVEAFCDAATRGRGVDGVLVCAGSSSNAIIELCGAVARQKGRVVVVGAVPMNIPRQDYFKKEISVVISRSYGPGRYDPAYEEQGNDYPLGYVRFTEQRNMEAFLDLVAQRRIDVADLITHRFAVDDAAKAYSLVEGERTEPYLGIVLSYTASNDAKKAHRIALKPQPVESDRVSLSFYGAGNYATASLLPPIVTSGLAHLNGLVTASGRSAQGVAARFGFTFCSGDYADLLRDDTDAVLIATRHDSHAVAVAAALAAGKHAYVEKPLGLTVEELASIRSAFENAGAAQLMVGFNRRFAPATQMVRSHFSGLGTPLVISIRINAGSIPATHWIQDPETGGGRIIGEACHFVDLASALAGARVKSVYAVGAGGRDKAAMLDDDCSIVLTLEDGSVASIIYTAAGSSAMPKEYVEVFGGGRSAQIGDFRTVTLFADGKSKVTRYAAQDKGQTAMIVAWLQGLKRGEAAVNPDMLFNTSLATIMVVESMLVGAPLEVDTALLDKLQ